MTTDAPWTCDACGAGNNAARTECWVCFRRRRTSHALVALPTRSRDPFPRAPGSGTAPIVMVILAVGGVALFAFMPGLGILYLIVVVPIVLLARPPDQLKGPLAIVGTVIGVLLATVSAFFFTCLGVVSMHGGIFGDGFNRGLLAGLFAAIATAIGLPIWIVARVRRRSRASKPWDEPGLWEGK